jgi:hypothetical protein
MNNILQMVSQFRSNPMAMISQRFNIPRNITSPQDMVQHLLDSGQITQDQLNNAMRMKDNPQFRNFMR